jgi:hypothetical protein
VRYGQVWFEDVEQGDLADVTRPAGGRQQQRQQHRRIAAATTSGNGGGVQVRSAYGRR